MRWWVLVAVLVVVTVVAVRVGRSRPLDPGIGDVVRVGVAQGASIPEYEQASRSELAGLSGSTEMYALVALRGYLPPDGLVPVSAGVQLVRVYARVPLAGEQPEIVSIDAFRAPGDVSAGMDEVALRKDREAAEYARQVAGASGSLREVYESGQRVSTAEAAAYRQHCSCVYALVVRAAPAQLAAVAERDGVRTVDPAPEVRRLDRAVFLPPLPEQRQVAGPPSAGAGPPVVGAGPPSAGAGPPVVGAGPPSAGAGPPGDSAQATVSPGAPPR
jgi:hypothetical protein